MGCLFLNYSYQELKGKKTHSCLLKSKAHESVSLNWISMHRPWAPVEALLLPGLRVCICFFICNRLMCFDTAPLWEVADRQCQYFLLKKNQNQTPPLEVLPYNMLFRIKWWSMQAGSFHLEKTLPIQPVHFLHPWSPFFVIFYFPSPLRKRKGVWIFTAFLAAAGLGNTGV